MQAFSLDAANGIPVKLQLKAHIKYQIMAGILHPSDQLPPLRDLAAGLGINLNTVVRAVSELEAEGYLYTHQGKGVFVPDEFPGQGHGAALRSLLAGVLGPAQAWGIPPQEMALALLAHGQLARPPQAVHQRLLLVGGSRLQLRRLQGELEAALPMIVEPVLAEEAPDKLRGADYRVVACTLFHGGDLKQRLPKACIVTLAGAAARDTFAQLKGLCPGTRVAIAARDWLQAARVRHSLELGGLGHLQLEPVAGQTPAALSPQLRRAAFVLCTPDCREIAREALPDQVPLLPEPAEVPAEAIATIRQVLGKPTASPNLHLRSSWV